MNTNVRAWHTRVFKVKETVWMLVLWGVWVGVSLHICFLSINRFVSNRKAFSNVAYSKTFYSTRLGGNFLFMAFCCISSLIKAVRSFTALDIKVCDTGEVCFVTHQKTSQLAH